jgi:xanthine dehydrogenase YagS FAD-binding subunit
VKPLQFINPSSIQEASQLVQPEDASAFLISGGTDLLDEIKEGVERPDKLINLIELEAMQGISFTSSGFEIGAGTTLSDIASHPDIVRDYTALLQAAESVATPQIRNVGTLGGNLCQRPRCWYYRSINFDCRKKGGSTCYAQVGENKFHAILGGSDCVIVHPSDMAVALISLNASITLTSASDSRNLAVEDFFTGPDVDITAENVLVPGEIVTSVTIPATTGNTKSIFLKAKERQGMDFASSSVAIAMEVSGGTITSVRVTLGGVAPIPWRAVAAESVLIGKSLTGVDLKEVGEAAVHRAKALEHNGYKVRLTAGLTRRAVDTLLSEWR